MLAQPFSVLCALVVSGLDTNMSTHSRAWPVVALLALLSCGGNGHNRNGWHGYRETHDARVQRIGRAGTGSRVQGTWVIAQDGVNVKGTLELYPPPDLRQGGEDPALLQSDLSTTRHMMFVVRVSERPWDLNAEVRTVEVEVLIRGDAILDGVPEDMRPMPGLTHPAVQASHRAEILIYPGMASAGGVPERLYLKGMGKGKTLTEDAGADSLLSYDFDESRTRDRLQRIENLILSSRVEKERLEHLGELVSVQIDGLNVYRSSKGHGHSDKIFSRANQTLKILRWHTTVRRWEDPALAKYRDGLAELFKGLMEARDAAWASRPKSKSIGEHTVDLVMVVPHLAETVADGIVETARTARDLGTYTADVFGEGLGVWDIQWEPWSAVGQAYASGKSTSEIAWSVVDSISDSVDYALYAAGNGDFAPLMNLGGELTVEILLMRGLGQAAKSRKVKSSKGEASSGSAGTAVAQRYQRALAKARAARAKLAQVKNIPGRVRDELDAIVEALSRSIKPQTVAATPGAPSGLVSGLDNLRHVYASVRLEKAKARTLSLLQSRGMIGKGARSSNGTLATIEALERHATTSKAKNALKSVFAHIDTLDHPAGFLRSLDQALSVSARFDVDDFASLLRRATQSADPTKYLDDIRWLSTLEPGARSRLGELIARERAPDLAWIRAADLAKKDLEGLAVDPGTNWAQLQRRAQLAEVLPPEIRAVIGRRVDDLTILPPGTEFWTPEKGFKQLRWKRDHGKGHPSLTVDSKRRIVVGGTDDLNRAALSRNMRKLAGKLKGHQDHHIVPLAVARDHEMFRAARTRGSPRWDPNHPDNGIQLPASPEARDAVARSEGMPIHNTKHSDYSLRVERAATDVVDELERIYGSLDQVPAAQLTASAKQLENEMRELVRTYEDTLK